MALIRTILFIVLFYYGFKFLAKIIAPLLLVKVANKMKEKANDSYKEEPTKSTIKEGETVIDKTPVKKNNSTNTVGEYVDFEEIH